MLDTIKSRFTTPLPPESKPSEDSGTHNAPLANELQDSPVFNFLNNLSPIQPVKPVHITQTFNALNFASLSSVFTSPHVSSIKESRFLRRHQLPDPSKPEFSFDHDHILGKPELDVANNASEQQKNIDPEDGIVDDASIQTSRVPVSKTECNSPSSCAKNETLLGLPRFGGCSVAVISEVNMGAGGQVEENKEGVGCEWESLFTDSGDLLIFDSPNNVDAFKKAMGPNPKPAPFVANEMLDVEEFCAVEYGEEVGDVTKQNAQSSFE